jgi:lysophospholipid hydrolase
MAASGAATSIVDASTAVISNAKQVLATPVVAQQAAETASTSTFGLLGRVILSILGVLPSILFWVSYTLPTWLFTLFSTTLTFTMNFSSL